MNPEREDWLIAGQGIAGTCLAWQLWHRGIRFTIADDDAGGSSLVAAGLVNPITGRNFEPSRDLESHLPEAVSFYQDVGSRIGRQIWHPMPVLRLASTEDEWRKISSKLDRADVRPWIADARPEIPPGGWAGAVELCGGGRLDTIGFLHGSRRFFEEQGLFCRGKVEPDAERPPTIWCEGAAGLIDGRYGPHRCAKGEILTLRAPRWDGTRIRIGAGGWLVPTGGGIFKAGATYEWDQLDRSPTDAGEARVREIATRLMDDDFDVIAHEAGVRPILRRSDPLIAPLPKGDWLFNGLGSKGSLYGPSSAGRLARWMVDGVEPEADFRYRSFPPPSAS